MHHDGVPGRSKSQLQGQITVGNGPERVQGGGPRKPQPVEAATDDVLRIEPQQVGRRGRGAHSAELRAHDAGQDIDRLGMMAPDALGLAGERGQHAVFGRPKHGRQFAPRRATGQQLGQFGVAAMQPIID